MMGNVTKTAQSKNNFVLEVIIFVCIIVVGFVYTKVNKDYYVATANVVVSVDVGSSTSDYNDTVLSKMHLASIVSLMKDNAVIGRANKEFEGGGISGGALSVSYDEDSLMLKLSYRDYSYQNSIDKLDAIISVCEEISSDGEFLPASIRIVRLSPDTNVYAESDDVKILIVSVICATIVVGAFMSVKVLVKN